MGTVLARGLLLWVTVAASASAFALEPAAGSLRVAVVAPPEQDHVAWAAARQLVLDAAGEGVGLTVEPAPLTDAPGESPGLLIMPVRSLAARVPALQILELPFFYASLDELRHKLDGALGKRLAADAAERGWKLVAIWDEGMHILSGLKRYDRARNLKAREFLITRPDPVAERQFRYWKADARRIDPRDRDRVLRECLIASRATTLQELLREQLYRVHLSVSLTNHRFEGWVVIAPLERWNQFPRQRRQALEAAIRATTAWQRRYAAEREAAALAELKQRGMRIHEVDAVEREAFRAALPDWSELLSDELSEETKRELIRLALAGTAAPVSAAAPAGTNPGTGAAPGSKGH